MLIKKSLVILLCAVLILGLAACGSNHPQGFGDSTFSIEELVEAASPAVAYIETAFGSGSGFVISPQGIIVTNYHVLEGADEAIIEIDGQTYTNPLVLAADDYSDIAILKVEASGLTWLPPVQKDVKQGEAVIALGNPEGLKGSVSEGIISSTDHTLEGVDFELLQTTAPMSPGSSGGPLLNMRGEFLGINTFTFESGQNLNFAVPAHIIPLVEPEAEGGQTLSKIFGKDSDGFFQYRSNDLAVVLSWEGSADLDLEIWSDELDYLGDAAALGECRDITLGSTGEEYFVFQDYPDTEFTTEYDLQRNFSSGRFIISPYFNQGLASSVNSRLTVYFPDGSNQELEKEIQSQGQWFAILVDVENQFVKVLDFFPEARLFGFLEWDSSADLDLFIWDDASDEIFFPANFNGHDVQSGMEGIEVFQFASYSGYDFASHQMDINVWMKDSGNPITDATFTLFDQGSKIEEFSHQFTPDSRGDYYWQVISLNAETQEYDVQQEVRKVVTD